MRQAQKDSVGDCECLGLSSCPATDSQLLDLGLLTGARPAVPPAVVHVIPRATLSHRLPALLQPGPEAGNTAHGSARFYHVYAFAMQRADGQAWGEQLPEGFLVGLQGSAEPSDVAGSPLLHPWGLLLHAELPAALPPLRLFLPVDSDSKCCTMAVARHGEQRRTG
jgi:hypothetical protein